MPEIPNRIEVKNKGKVSTFFKDIFINKKKFRGAVLVLGIFSAGFGMVSGNLWQNYEQAKLLEDKVHHFNSSIEFILSVMKSDYSSKRKEHNLSDLRDYLLRGKTKFSHSGKTGDLPPDKNSVLNGVFLKDLTISGTRYSFEYQVDRGAKECSSCHDDNIGMLSYEQDLSEELNAILKISAIVGSLISSILFLLGLYGLNNKKNSIKNAMLIESLLHEKEKTQRHLNEVRSLNQDLQCERDKTQGHLDEAVKLTNDLSDQQVIIVNNGIDIERKIKELERLRRFFSQAPIAMFRFVSVNDGFEMSESNEATLNMPGEFNQLIDREGKKGSSLNEIFHNGIDKDDFIRNSRVKTSNVYLGGKVYSVLGVGDPELSCINFYFSDITELYRLRQFPRYNINPLYSLSFNDEDKLVASTINDPSIEAKEIIGKTSNIESEILANVTEKEIRSLIGTSDKTKEFVLKIGNETYKWWLRGVENSDVVHFYSNNITREISILASLLSSEEEEARIVERINIPGLDLAFYHQSLDRGSKYGGDFLFFIPTLQEGVIKFVMGDAAGKGLEAALIVNNIRRIIFENKEVMSSRSPEEVLRIINDNVITSPKCKFATGVCVFIDFNKGQLHISNASHDSPILISSDLDGINMNAKTSGMALGIVKGGIKGFNYSDSSLSKKPDLDSRGNKCTKLKVGDKILIFTDGLTEATNSEGVMFNSERGGNKLRFHQVIEENKHLPAEEIKKKIIDEIEIWTGGKGVHDDIILFILEITPEYKSNVLNTCEARIKTAIVDGIEELGLNSSEIYDLFMLMIEQEQRSLFIIKEREKEIISHQLTDSQESEERIRKILDGQRIKIISEQLNIFKKNFQRNITTQAKFITKQLSNNGNMKEVDIVNMTKILLKRNIDDQIELTENILRAKLSGQKSAESQELISKVLKRFQSMQDKIILDAIAIALGKKAKKRKVKPKIDYGSGNNVDGFKGRTVFKNRGGANKLLRRTGKRGF